jgi:hypothetical protein
MSRKTALLTAMATTVLVAGAACERRDADDTTVRIQTGTDTIRDTVRDTVRDTIRDTVRDTTP